MIILRYNTFSRFFLFPKIYKIGFDLYYMTLYIVRNYSWSFSPEISRRKRDKIARLSQQYPNSHIEIASRLGLQDEWVIAAVTVDVFITFWIAILWHLISISIIDLIYTSILSSLPILLSVYYWIIILICQKKL